MFEEDTLFMIAVFCTFVPLALLGILLVKASRKIKEATKKKSSGIVEPSDVYIMPSGIGLEFLGTKRTKGIPGFNSLEGQISVRGKRGVWGTFHIPDSVATVRLIELRSGLLALAKINMDTAKLDGKAWIRGMKPNTEGYEIELRTKGDINEKG